MIICLEGPDKVGKTTMAKRFQTEFTRSGIPTVMLKRGPIKNDPMTEYLKPLEIMAQEPEVVYILDRWHVGEMIYGPLLRGESKIDEFQAAYIEMVMQSIGALFMHVYAPVSTMLERWDEKPDELISRDWLIDLAVSYDRYESSRNHWVRVGSNVNYSTLPHSMLPSPFGGQYIGPKKPRVLLVGDVRGKDDFIFPFVPRLATSGHWMMQAMGTANVKVMDVGIVNGNELKTDSLISLWGQIGEPPVVTLGNNANDAWQATEGPNCYQIPHPQYMRRFKHKELKSYGNLIKAAMKE